MKAIARIVIGLLLTFPIYVGVAAMPWLSDWFNNGNGWSIVAPVFRMLGSVGGEQNDDYLFGSLLVISFILALIVATIIVSIYGRVMRGRAPRHV